MGQITKCKKERKTKKDSRKMRKESANKKREKKEEKIEHNFPHGGSKKEKENKLTSGVRGASASEKVKPNWRCWSSGQTAQSDLVWVVRFAI